MSTFIEYELEDGLTIMILASEETKTGRTQVARDKDGNVIKRAGKTFSEALENIKVQAKIMVNKLADLRADEVKVKFGLSATGELGNFAIGKVGAEANYEVTFTWNNSKSKT